MKVVTPPFKNLSHLGDNGDNMEEDIPYGWAGQIFINSSLGETIEWCRSNMKKHDYDITQYDNDLCLVRIKKQKDLMLAILRWG